jgi:sarcosine oxidase subunit gamma
VSLPIPNQSTLSPDKSARVVWSTPDQYLIYGSENISKRCFSKLSDVAYMTDQSHATVAVRLSGSGVWDILERISPVDMHRDIFRVHHVTRIATEHISITILRESEDGFILSSPSSSAGSFLHILTTTIEYLS